MKPLLRLAVFAGATLLALLVAEGGLRLLPPAARPAASQPPVMGWASEEYQQFDPRSDDDAGGTRVLVLGDSFLARPPAPEPDRRFPTLLQERLGARAVWRTLASEGWGTDQQLLAFREKGRAWAPDVVLLAFCANYDLANICSHDHGPDQLKPYFVLEDGGRLALFDGHGAPLDAATRIERASGGSRLLEALRLRLQRPATGGSSGATVATGASDGSSAAGLDAEARFAAVDPRYRRFRFLEERPQELYARQGTLTWSPQLGVNHVSAYLHEDFETNAYQWRLFEALLATLRTEVETAGARLVVLLLPVIFDPRSAETIAGGSFEQRFETPDGPFTFRSAEPRERLQRIAERVGVDFIDPTPEFIGRVRDEELMPEVWPDPRDRHFSARGHELLADFLQAHARLGAER